jgi:ligand-binding SRPBCC domain-containing protein
MPVLERTVDIAAPVADVFAFHLDTRNAALISPPGARIVGLEGEVPVLPGSVVTMRMRRGRLPVTISWRVRIEAVERDRLIVDVAERSPFAAWRHEHLFSPRDNGTTRMTDRVTYRVHGGPIGRLADRLVVRRALERAFAERHRLTRELLERRAAAAG